MSNIACRARQLSQHHDQFHADHLWSYPYGIIKSVIATITTIWLLRPKAVSKQLLSNQGKPMPIWVQDLDRRFVVIYRSPWSRSGWVWQIWQDSSSRGQIPSTNYEILNQNFKSQPMNWLADELVNIIPPKKVLYTCNCHLAKKQYDHQLSHVQAAMEHSKARKRLSDCYTFCGRGCCIKLHFAKFRQAVLDAN